MNYRILVVFVILLSRRCFGGDAVVSQILDSMEDYQQTVNTVDVRFVVRGSPDWRFASMEQQPGYQWRWVKSGRKQMITQDAAVVPGAAALNRIWASFDGDKGYAVYYHDRDQTVAKRVDVTPAEPISLVVNQHVAGVLGWRQLHQHIPDTLITLTRKRLKEAVCVEDPIEGEPCWKVSLGDVGAFVAGGPHHEVVAWFSKRCGLLPRRIAVLPLVPNPETSASVKLPEGSFPCFVDVLEYGQVDDPLFKKTRWFPMKIQSRDLFSNEVSIQSVAINSKISPDTFVPGMPPGTEVLTMRPGATMSLTHYVGGEQGESLYRERLQQFSPAKTAPPHKQSAPVNASPQKSSYLMRLFLVCSVFFTVAALVVAKYRGRWF